MNISKILFKLNFTYTYVVWSKIIILHSSNVRVSDSWYSVCCDSSHQAITVLLAK